MNNRRAGKIIALEAWKALVQQGNYLKDKFGDTFVFVDDKYLSYDAIAQIEDVKAFLKEKNPQIKFPEPEQYEGGEMMAEEMMEGGEDLYA